MLVKVKEWILRKNLSTEEYQALQGDYIGNVKKQTEKAYLVEFHTKFGKITSWVPKSQTLYIEGKIEQQEPKKEKEIDYDALTALIGNY